MIAPAPQTNPYQDFVDRYYDAPSLFVREVFQSEPDDWQSTVLELIALGERRISVRSGHGVGKSTCFAWAAIWYITTRYPVKVVMTAPTSPQLFDALWSELARWINALPDYVKVLLNPTADRVELVAAPNEAFVTARTSRAETPEALQGVHSENVMLIVDEASGVPEAVYEAATGSMSGHNAVTLLAGNPVRTSGYFYRTHHEMRHMWNTLKVSCLDCKRVSQDYINQIIADYGEDSNAYRVRVLGEFPKAEEDVVIPLELVEAARARDIRVSPNAREVWGLDVARFGGDSNSLVRRRGDIVIPPMRWAGVDLMVTAGRVVAEYESALVKPEEIIIDAIGVGAGVVDRLREITIDGKPLPIRGLNVSESSASKEKFLNLRAELWWMMREWFQRLQCQMPKDENLVSQLVDVRYKFTSNGKIQIESKEDIKKRKRGKSPDCADALALTFASRPASLGGVAGVNRNKPLIRNLSNLD